MRNKMNPGGRGTTAVPHYGSSSGSQQPPPPPPPPSSVASQYSSSSASRNAIDREAEKMKARMNREKNALSRPKPVAPLFKVTRRDDDLDEPLTQNITNSLGNFNTFCQMKPAFGVEQAPPTPLPSHQMHDPDDIVFPTRSPPPPLVSGNSIPPPYGGGGTAPPPNNNHMWKPPQTSNSSTLDPRIGSNSAKYSSFNNTTNGRPLTQPPPSSVVPKSNGSGGNGRLRPEQINAAAARAVAHRSSLAALSTISRTSPVRPTIVPMSINEMAASFDLPDSIITPIKEPPRGEFTKNNRARRALLPHPTGITPTTPVLQPQPHVPPPPQSAYRQQSEAKTQDCNLTPWGVRSGDDATPVKSNQRNIGLICAEYPSQIDLSEESEEEGEIRERPRTSAPSGSAPSIPTSQALPPATNFNSVVDDDLLISDDDSSKSTSDSTSSESEDTSTSSDEESNNKAKSSWNLSDLFKHQANAAAGNPGNAASKDQLASKATSANSDVSGDRNHGQERRGAGNSSLQRSPRRAAATVAARIATSPIVSEESSDEDTPTTRPIPQITAVPRPVEPSRSPYSSDSDAEPEPTRPAPAYPKKGNKRSASVAKRQTAPSSKKSKMVPTVVAAPVVTAAPPLPKTGRRGRPRKVVEVIPESKMKSKQFISTDDSDSDDEMNKRRNVYAKAGRSRQSSTRSNSSLRRSPRRPSPACAAISTSPAVKTTSSVNSHQKVNTAPLRDSDVVPAKVQQEHKPKPQEVSFLPPSMTMEFEFPTTVLPKPPNVDVESTKKTTEMCRTTASITSDPNKKKWLGMLYGKSKDHANNQHDSASGKGKDSEKRTIKEKSVEAPLVKKPNKQPEGEVKQATSKRSRDSSVVDANPTKKSKSEDSETSKSSRRGTKQSKSNGVPEVAAAPSVAEDLPPIASFSPPKKSKRSHRHDESSTSNRGLRGGSRCNTPASSNTPQHDSDQGRTTPATSEPQQLDFRVPLDGETSYAYQSRQSSVTPTTIYSTAEPTPTNASSTSSSNLNGVDAEEPRIAQSADTVDYTVDGQLISGGRTVSNRFTSRPPTTPVQDYYPPPSTLSRVRPTPTRYGSVVLPENVSCLYPSIAELEGKCIDDIFRVLFGCPADTITYQKNKVFVDQAIALKRKADGLNTERTTIIGTYYIEAVLYFIIAVQAMETDIMGVSPAITMCTGTMNVVAWLFSLIKKNSSQQLHAEYKAKLEVFCLLCQSMLSLKVYTMKRDELRCSQPILQEFYNRRSTPAATADNGAGNGGGGVGGSGSGTGTVNTSTTNQAANSPSTQSTPSPAESVNSESSHSSGYNTSNERRPPVNATPSPPQPPPLPSLSEILRHQYTHYSVTTYLQSAYDTWCDAQQLIVSNKLQVFFAYLDRAVFPLSLHSNTLQLVCYIKAGLREIDRTMAHHIERNKSQQNERAPTHHSGDRNVAHHSDRTGATHHNDRIRVHGSSPAGAVASSVNRANAGVVPGSTPDH